MGWGPTVEPYNVYTNDRKNGATMLSIALGHATDALCHCLGEVLELSATMTVRRKSFTITGTGESRPMNTDDQVLVTGLLEDGAAFSIHYRGGVSRGTNLLWEINGTEGDLQLTAAGGQAQIFEMTVHGGKGAQSSLEVLPVPEKYRWAPPQGPSTNVAQAYALFARDYREGTHLCPTFDASALFFAIVLSSLGRERPRLHFSFAFVYGGYVSSGGCLAVDKPEPRRHCSFGEEAFASTQGDRENLEAELVNEVVLQQCLNQFPTAMNLKFWAVLLLEFPDLMGSIARNEFGIGPVKLLQRL